MALKPCLDCGRITTGSRCRSCRRASPYQQPAWRVLSDFVVARDGSCRECGSTHYLAAHHVVPRREGGADHPANLTWRCARAATAESKRKRGRCDGAAPRGLLGAGRATLTPTRLAVSSKRYASPPGRPKSHRSLHLTEGPVSGALSEKGDGFSVLLVRGEIVAALGDTSNPRRSARC